MMSTGFYSFQLSSAHLFGVQRREPIHQLIGQMMEEGVFPNLIKRRDDTPGVFRAMQGLVLSCTGCKVPDAYILNRDWGSIDTCTRIEDDPALAQGVANLNSGVSASPRFGRMLVIHFALISLPQEWGLSGPSPTIDFSHELVTMGNVA